VCWAGGLETFLKAPSLSTEMGAPLSVPAAATTVGVKNDPNLRRV